MRQKHWRQTGRGSSIYSRQIIDACQASAQNNTDALNRYPTPCAIRLSGVGDRSPAGSLYDYLIFGSRFPATTVVTKARRSLKGQSRVAVMRWVRSPTAARDAPVRIGWRACPQRVASPSGSLL